MAEDDPMPQITRRKKVIRTGDKGRTIQGKNFPEWKKGSKRGLNGLAKHLEKKD